MSPEPNSPNAKPVCSLVIPCYNFAGGLAATFARIEAWRSVSAPGWRVIFVDDGSRDRTADVLRDYARGKEPWFDFVILEKNSGKGAAVRAGLLRAAEKGADVAFFTDCDLHYGLEIITDRMLAELESSDVVIVDRTWDESSRHARRRRRFASWAFRESVALLAGLSYVDSQAGMKGLRLAPFRHLFPLLRIDGFAFDVELLSIALFHGFRVHQVQVRFAHGYGFPAQSTVSLARASIKMFLDLLRINLNWKRGRYHSDSLVRMVDGRVYLIQDESR